MARHELAPASRALAARSLRLALFAPRALR
jgi:hypothetical protein